MSTHRLSQDPKSREIFFVLFWVDRNERIERTCLTDFFLVEKF